MAVIEGTQALKTFSGEYDFAVDGGAIGTIPMRASPGSQGDLPIGAIIEGGFVETVTPLGAGAGATVAIQAEAANDIVTATLFSASPWVGAGRFSVIPAFTGATSVKTTVRRAPSVVIAVNALTAGKFRVVLHYR